MRRKKWLVAVGCLAVLATACDDGRIAEAETSLQEAGYSVRLTGNFRHLAQWADGYSVVLAGFEEDNDYAVILKALPLNQADSSEVVMDLNGIGEEVASLRLCAVDRLRERVYDFKTWLVTDLELHGDTTVLAAGTLAAGMYDALQQGLFNKTCIACHGAGERPAAGLNLLEGESRAMLVGHPAVLQLDDLRVWPGKADASILYRMLATGMSAGMGIDHSDMLPAGDQLLTLLKTWIDDGAK